jgi:hypothetical protein
VTEKLKVWMLVITAVCFTSATVALVLVCTVAPLRAIAAQLVELNHNVERLPATASASKDQ